MQKLLKKPYMQCGSLVKFHPDASTVLWLPGQNDAYSSVIRDFSGNANHGTITGALWTRNSKGLWELSFDGTDDVVTVTSHASLQPANITVMAWVNPTTLAAAWIDEVISCEAAGFTGWGLRFSSTKSSFYIEDGASAPEKQGNVCTAGKWIHLTGVYDGSAVYLYENGASVGAGTAAAGPIAYAATNVQIGKNPADATRILTGKVALVRIFNRALTTTEIAQHYAQERSLFGV
ncbi:MAG: LamG domain-containing protein [Patescibacteria group bacterium]|jgi:hypothetical protein